MKTVNKAMAKHDCWVCRTVCRNLRLRAARARYFRKQQDQER